MAGFVIHTRHGLCPAEVELAAELGPADVGASAPPEALSSEAGLVDVQQIDITKPFLQTCQAIVTGRKTAETALRKAEGDESYEQELARTRDMLNGIELGLLRRCLLLGRKP